MRALRTCAADPDHMVAWIREAADGASANAISGFEKWFEHRTRSGSGFRRADLLPYSHGFEAVGKAESLYLVIFYYKCGVRESRRGYGWPASDLDTQALLQRVCR